jgi:phosphoribosylaminoimidazole-succinocarboxamide synthase
MKLQNEGKTKRIWEEEDEEESRGTVIVESKDDLTAGDGAKHDVVVGKGALANQTTCNVFRLLQKFDLPIAFIRQIDGTRFRARKCTMLPFEVVVRRAAHGSYLHRFPNLRAGHIFPDLKVEFFAKTNGKMWETTPIPMDDPLLDFPGDSVDFYLPHWTDEQKKISKETGFTWFLVDQKPFLSILCDNFFFSVGSTLPQLELTAAIAEMTFSILEQAWKIVGGQLVDFKLEFGVDERGNLLLADVIDNDSWRVLQEGKHLDKQFYRDGADINEVTAKYRQVTELTERFESLKQSIIL